MKTLVLATTLAGLVIGAAPTFAGEFGADARLALGPISTDATTILERHGRRNDDPAGDDHIDRRGRGSRTPGGSGCDSPRDRIEHPECRG